ncbi:MAG: 5-(carboxyamino)imidazole ribonucleotide synthase, partial [Verrucomicrobiota bacterium]
LTPVVMLNLLGDIWSTKEPDWTSILKTPGTSLHLYGKSEARPGRKMGHINFLSDSVEKALSTAKKIKDDLLKP